MTDQKTPTAAAVGHQQQARGPGWLRWVVGAAVTCGTLGGAWQAGAFAPEAPAAEAWTCPMHPSVAKPEPGNCPICGMYLMPKDQPVLPAVQRRAQAGAAPVAAATDARSPHAEPASDLFAAYESLFQALVAGDAASASAAAIRLAPLAAGDAELTALVRAFPTALAAQRLQFAPLSEAMIARAAKLGAGGPNLIVVLCPMAKARWLQPKGAIHNPYFGSEMPACGVDQGPAKQAPRQP